MTNSCTYSTTTTTPQWLRKHKVPITAPLACCTPSLEPGTHLGLSEPFHAGILPRISFQNGSTSSCVQEAESRDYVFCLCIPISRTVSGCINYEMKQSQTSRGERVTSDRKSRGHFSVLSYFAYSINGFLSHSKKSKDFTVAFKTTVTCPCSPALIFHYALLHSPCSSCLACS